jgi:hypothetical protein
VNPSLGSLSLSVFFLSRSLSLNEEAINEFVFELYDLVISSSDRYVLQPLFIPLVFQSIKGDKERNSFSLRGEIFPFD